MGFINALIYGGPGKEIEFRMHIRCEFLQLGLLELIHVRHYDFNLQKISDIEHDDLQMQIDVWISGFEVIKMMLIFLGR
jgi:hypothetical protein